MVRVQTQAKAAHHRPDLYVPLLHETTTVRNHSGAEPQRCGTTTVRNHSGAEPQWCGTTAVRNRGAHFEQLGVAACGRRGKHADALPSLQRKTRGEREQSNERPPELKLVVAPAALPWVVPRIHTALDQTRMIMPQQTLLPMGMDATACAWLHARAAGAWLHARAAFMWLHARAVGVWRGARAAGV